MSGATVQDPAVASTSNPDSNYSTAHGGIRSQLAQLRPKHAVFQVKLSIHQVSNVPYVRGEFGVKWRFKNVVSAPPHASLLSRIRAHRTTSGRSSVKGKEKAVEGPEIVVHDEDEADQGSAGSGEDQYSLGEWGERKANANLSSLSLDLLKPAPVSPKAPLSPMNTSTPSDSQSSLGNGVVYSDAKGMTEYLPLRGHSVKWEHTITVVVQMDVQRDTLDLLPNELKLVVKQRVIPGDPDSPENPRLGHVLLNLAEYANAGPVTRNYLLRQSKTNAILKLTVELTHIGGETRFRAPPLRKGEILAGVSGLLSNDAYRSPAWLSRTLDLYGDVPGLDLGRDGPRTTETLIEAIFNPVPTTSDADSPFTYYVPPGSAKARELEEKEKVKEDSSSGTLDSEEKRSVVSGTDSASVLTSSGASPSLASGSNSDAGSASGKHKGWWSRHKLGAVHTSRPGTPNLLLRRQERERPIINIVPPRTESGVGKA